MKYILLILLLFTFLGTSNGQSSNKSNDDSKPKPEISVGLWIDQIGNIDYSNQFMNLKITLTWPILGIVKYYIIK